MRKVMTIEEYCNKNNKQTLLQNFMLDINPDPSKNMCCADSAICSRYSDTTFLFNFKCHICNTEWEGSGYSYIVKELTCPTCNEDSTHQKIKYASVKKGSLTLLDWCNDHEDDGQRIIDDGQRIIDEYDNENNELTREEAFRLSYSSVVQLNWKCKEHGHQWSASIKTRTKGSNCPKCGYKKAAEKNSKPTTENSISTWCSNNERGKQIQSEWTGITEDDRQLTMDEVAYSSHIKMLWRCADGHKWYAIVNDRTHGRNCPECYNRNRSEFVRKTKTNSENYLSTWCLNNPEIGRIITSQWTGVCENGKIYTMDEVAYASKLKMLWRCADGHEWYTSIGTRTRGHGCPYCPNNNVRIRVSDENSLYTWCEENKTQGNIIKLDWLGIDEDDNNISMTEISYGSSKKVWWMCHKCNFKWLGSVHYRTACGRGCKKCNRTGTSYNEQYIYWALKQLFPDTKNRYKTFKDIDSRGIELDVYIKELNLAIEYSPTYWHDNRNDRDNLKKRLCEQNNIRLIQIIEDSYDEYKEKYTEIFTEDCIYVPTLVSSNKDNYLLKIVSYILNSIGHSIEEIDVNLVKQNALDYSKKKIEYEKSVEFIYPTLAAEFHPTLNTVKPSEITPGSHIRIKFLCPNCQYGSQGEWETEIATRVCKRSSCIKCKYNWYEQLSGERPKREIKNIKKAEYEKSIEFLHPELAKEFHPSNTIKPSEVSFGSNLKIKFLCPNCGYGSKEEWETRVVDRTYSKKGCKQCGYNWYKAETNQPQNIKSQYRKSATPSKPKPFKIVELSDIDKEMQSWDF